MHDGFQLVKRYGQTALFLINLFRCSEPKHVFSPLGNCFDVQKMLDAYVFADGVAAPRAAAECERRRQLKVVQVADTALRGGCIYKNTAGFHTGREFIQLFLLCEHIEINRGGVTVAAVRNELVRLRKRVLNVV